MVQKIFDTDNEEDMALLWDIFPTDTRKIELGKGNDFYLYNGTSFIACISCDIIKINWHDKTEITRPIQEATEADVGKLCKFWETNNYEFIGVLGKMRERTEQRIYNVDGLTIWWTHCRRLTKQEIEELC